MRLPILNELLDMLTYCRPHGSGTERTFIDRWIKPLPNAYRDPYGNWHVPVGASKILWSSHTDTVHWEDGRQTIAYNPANGIVKLSRKSRRRSRCLGADCTAGVFVMINMIRNEVPGHYVFHTGEERGCIGSSALAEHEPDWLRTFEFAIAFDRRGTKSIITEQGCGVSASDQFALSLSEELRKYDLDMHADPTGILTDTAEYMHLIPECSNLSVGFSHEHSRDESLDTRHLIKLTLAMCQLDHSALIADRIPRDPRDDRYWPSWYRDVLIDDPNAYLFEDEDDRPSGIDAPYDRYRDAPIWMRDKDDDYIEEANTYLDPTFAKIQRSHLSLRCATDPPSVGRRKGRTRRASGSRKSRTKGRRREGR